MKTRQISAFFVRLGVVLAANAWAACSFAAHPIQHNWEFRFQAGDARSFSVGGGFSSIEQRAKLEGALFIDDHDHGMPILRDIQMRLVDVVSVELLTGEIVPPPPEPFIREGDLLEDVLLNPLDVYSFGTLTQDVESIHMEFTGMGPDAYDTLSETRLRMVLADNDLTLFGSSRNWADDGIEMFIDPTFGVLIPQPTCDFDGNRSCDLDDINRLMTQIAGGDHNIRFDLNNDSRVSDGDHDQWLKLAAQERGLREAYLVGDSNLNGMVGPEDLNALGRHWQRGSHLWSAGNFTGGNVNSADLNALALNWRKSIRTPPAANAVVPEPSTLLLMVFAIALVCGVRGNSTRQR